MAYAEKHQDQLCSGAFSWKDEGCVTEVGWVADLVHSGIPVGQMLCPTNEGRLSEVYNELLGLAAADPCVDRLGGPPTRLPDGSLQENACRLLASAADKEQIIRQHIYEKHYNTNYVATWFLTLRGATAGFQRKPQVQGRLPTVAQVSSVHGWSPHPSAARYREDLGEFHSFARRLRGQPAFFRKASDPTRWERLSSIH